MKKLVMCAGLSAFMALQGCATQNGEAGSASNDKRNRIVVGALIGAISGVAVSKATGGDKTGRDAAIGAAVGGIGGYIWNQKMEAQRAAMEKATAGTGIEVAKTPNNELKLDVPADAGFATNRSDIQPRLQQILSTFSQTLKDNSTTHVKIVGHTDSNGRDALNDPLSVSRARTTRDYIVSKGVADNRTSIEGMGSRMPVADNGTETGRARNRRIEIFVTQSAS